MGRRRFEALSHPAFTGAVALLALNDQLLKAAIPGWWTGKLSDLAGVFAAALLAGTVLRRPLLGPVLAGGGFAALKLSGTAATAAAPFLGGVTRQDPTDLLALAMVWPAVTFLKRYENGSSAPGSRVAPAAFAIVALTVMTATSCDPPGVVDLVVGGDGVAYARISDDMEDRWAVSEDGGATWEETSGPPQETVVRSCTSAGECFRLQDASVQARERGEPWAEQYSFSEDELARMRRRANSCELLGPEEDLFRALAVVGGPGGEHVVVAMGTQGALHRDPAGEWSRVSVLDREPRSLFGPTWLYQLWQTPLFVAGLGALVFMFGVLRRKPAYTRLGGIIAGAAMGVVFLGAAIALVVPPFSDYAVFGPTLAALSIVALAISIRRFRRRAFSTSRTPS